MKRIPLWMTLLPLVAGVGLYWYLWSGWADGFKAVLQGWLPGTTVEITGFPYRMEANIVSPRLAGGAAVKLTASADRARINRGPWQPELTVVGADAPRLAAVVSEVLRVDIAGKTAASSVHVIDGRLARLSTVIEAATARLGFTPLAIAADTLELHMRELRDAAAAAAGPAGAPRGQLVIVGQRLQLGGGDALTLNADLTVTGDARLTGYDAWAKSGTVEVKTLSLADASGEVASVRATLVPEGRTGLRIVGTIETICPQTIAAATSAAPPVSEKRLRAPLRLAFEATAGVMKLAALPTDLATRATRGQVPPCPVVRR